jgi:hypothetical protein
VVGLRYLKAQAEKLPPSLAPWRGTAARTARNAFSIGTAETNYWRPLLAGSLKRKLTTRAERLTKHTEPSGGPDGSGCRRFA